MKLRVLVISLLMLAASSAFAQAEPDFERDVLGAIDVVPTAAWLDATFEDPQGKLIQAAHNSESYARRRAITLLSLYPNARTRDALQQLSTTGDADSRAFAVYTLGRMYGQAADDALVQLVVAQTASADAEVAKWATRALRWIASPAAVQQLETIAASSSPNAGIARRALRQHVSVTVPKY